MEFSNDWFDRAAKGIWDEIIPQIKPRKILEIGSYEGRSICYLIEKLSEPGFALEIHAVDSWAGGSDFMSKRIAQEQPFDIIEKRFGQNTAEAINENTNTVFLQKHKGTSTKILSEMISDGKYDNYFDFVYIDGSHETTDVLSDAVMSWNLLKKGGVMGFDDYLWQIGNDQKYRPKLAVDAFVNLYNYKLQVIGTHSSQVYVNKL